MKLKFNYLYGLIISFIFGGLFSFLMLYIFFTEVDSGSLLGVVKEIIIWTIGLPLMLSMTIASTGFVRELLCSPYGQSTFGCWGASSLGIAILVYGLIFSMGYSFIYLGKSKKA